MNTADIIALKNELVTRDAARHRRYDINIAAIGGSYDRRRMDGYWELYESVTGRTVPTDREQHQFAINFIPSIIETQRSFIATVPSVQCPVPAPTAAGETKTRGRAEKLERVYRGFWNHSNIGRRMNQLGYWNPALGSTIGVVWPDMKNKRPILQMRSPYGCYPVLADVDGYELAQIIFLTKYKRHQAAAMYPQFRSAIMSLEGDVEVVQYIDSEAITVIVDGQHRVKDIRNKWGFVPAVIIPNSSFGEGPWGDDSISHVIPLQDEYVYRESLKTTILEQTILQPLVIEAGDNLPDEIPMGPRDAIPVKAGGRVYRLQPVQVPYQYLQSQSDLIKLIDRVGAVPDVLRSQFEGNVLTGKGVSALLGPTQMTFNVKGNEIYPALSMLNKMAMKMWHKMWPRAEHTVYFLDHGNHMQVESFKTGEFEGWYENVVYVDASSYFDSQSRFVSVLQALQNRLMSRQTAMQFVPGVDDPVNEQALIDREFEKDMQLQQAAMAFSEANVQPDMASQGMTNYSLGKGYMGETPTPEPIGGFEVGQPAEQEAMAGEGSGFLDDIIEMLSGVTLRGRVWLAGNIVTDPDYSPSSPSWNGIDIFVEDPNDKGAINTTMRNQFPEVHGSINYHEGEPSPDEPAMLVSDEGDEGESTDDAAMMEALMSGGEQGMPGMPPGMV